MNHTNNDTQYKAGTLFIKILMVLCVAVLAIYLAKHFGTQYAERKVQEQLEKSGLAPFVQYESMHFNPFEIAISLEDVRFGLPSAPWVNFSRITLNYHPTQPSHLDVDFWIKQAEAADLSRETQYWMRQAGIATLLGKGAFSSIKEGSSVTSEFQLDIKNIGRLAAASNLKVFDQNLSMMELRTDMLASMAMGQPEGVFIIHGDAVEIQSTRLQYEDMGLMQKVDKNGLYEWIDSLGLAPYVSVEADHIASVLSEFLQDNLLPEQQRALTIEVLPPSPMTLKDAALWAGDKLLYKKASMSISNEASASN